MIRETIKGKYHLFIQFLLLRVLLSLLGSRRKQKTNLLNLPAYIHACILGQIIQHTKRKTN